MKILFVCTGNICRSPTAHAVMRHKVRAAGRADIVVDSAGTHGYHTGEGADRRAVAAAQARGYAMDDLRARPVTHADFADFDLILCMDAGHKLILERVAPKDAQHKIRMFDRRDVGDPYYGGESGFEDVLDQIEAACDVWLDAV